MSYYNTEYIFITNQNSQAISVAFDLVLATIPAEWSVTGCTNLICYTKVPDNGSMGVLQPNQEGYMSINLSANNVAGDAEISFAVFDEANPQNRDTITFIYHALAQTNLLPAPWAQVNFAQNVLTVFIENESVKTQLDVFDLSGKNIVAMQLDAITSVSMSDFPGGIYVVVVRDDQGKKLIQKIVKT